MIASQISQLPARRSGTKQFCEKNVVLIICFYSKTILSRKKDGQKCPQNYTTTWVQLVPRQKLKKKLGWGRTDADDVYDDRSHMRWEEETSTL